MELSHFSFWSRWKQQRCGCLISYHNNLLLKTTLFLHWFDSRYWETPGAYNDLGPGKSHLLYYGASWLFFKTTRTERKILKAVVFFNILH